jgi:hypothetical protein
MIDNTVLLFIFFLSSPFILKKTHKKPYASFCEQKASHEKVNSNIVNRNAWLPSAASDSYQKA